MKQNIVIKHITKQANLYTLHKNKPSGGGQSSAEKEHIMNERKYFVKSAYRTNLETMLTKLHCYNYDMQDGEIENVEIMGKTYDLDSIYDLIEECQQLLLKANSGKVTGKEYGRIKAISDERDLMRYNTCIANGMDESKASYAFLG